MKKKVISAILCGAMVLGTVCPVLAADDKKTILRQKQQLAIPQKTKDRSGW